MGELLVEVVVQVLWAAVSHVVLDPYERKHGAKGCAEAVGVALACIAVLAVSIAWGKHVRELGTIDFPRSAIVASILVGVGLAGAVVQHLRAESTIAAPLPSLAEPVPSETLASRLTDTVAPWRWPPRRLVTFAVLNAISVLGLVVGFQIGTAPHIPQ
jgi:hypothetical protein